MYRHVALLAAAGVLEVADEQRVRGAMERHYRLRRERSVIETGAAASMSLDDHRRGFAAAMAALLAEFDAYLDREGADPTADLVGYRQGILWLSPDDLDEMIDAMRAILASRSVNDPVAGRSPYLLSMILFPSEEPPGQVADRRAEDQT